MNFGYFKFYLPLLFGSLLFLFKNIFQPSSLGWNNKTIDRDSKEKDKDKSGNNLAVPRLSVCADAQKVDRAKLAQTEFTIIEFDPDTFRVLLDYLHTGTCPLTCVSIPGEIPYIYAITPLIINLYLLPAQVYFVLPNIMTCPNCCKLVFITANNFCV